LETSYFDQILHHQSRPEHHHLGCGSEENTDSPF
jgi:hypothetical protein